MQQYRPHYHWCQLLKEFVFFTCNPKKPKKFVRCLKLTSWLTLISSLTKVTIQELLIFADFAVANRTTAQMQCSLLAAKGGCPLIPATHPVPVPSPPHAALCTCQNLCPTAECGNTAEHCSCKTTTTKKHSVFCQVNELSRLCNQLDSTRVNAQETQDHAAGIKRKHTHG